MNDLLPGLPHALRQDDIYGEYLLPKASIIIPNVWSACPVMPVMRCGAHNSHGQANDA